MARRLKKRKTPSARRFDDEHQSQVSVIRWADTVAICVWPEYVIKLERKMAVGNGHRMVRHETFPLFAVPNGGDRNVIVASKLRAEGVRSGVPDLWLPIPMGKYAGLVIEMKRDKGRTSKNQATWIAYLQERGYAVTVCFSAAEAVQSITDYLSGQWATVAQKLD